MDKILENKVKAFKKALTAEGIPCLREKEINYGYQIVCGSKDTVTVNIYHGKKGLSIVVQGKSSSLKQQVSRLLSTSEGHLTAQRSTADTVAGTKAVINGDDFVGLPQQDSGISLHPEGISAWMGCDESGKGDVFGPLAAAACIITMAEESQLRSLGVCDSKLLDDRRIAVLAGKIKSLLEDRCIVHVLMPYEYNRCYDQMRRNHKNLNHLLGNVHAENIRVLLSKHDCPCIIVDKFGKEEYVLTGLKDITHSHTIIQVPRGERDVAVAAASILARQAFVEAMNELSHTYDMSFPKGAWLGISEAIHSFTCRYGEENLDHVGKLNFKNFDFLRR